MKPLIVLVLLVVSLSVTAKLRNEKIVRYSTIAVEMCTSYHNKNLKKELVTEKVKVKKLIAMVDVYEGTEREVYCTLVTERTKRNKIVEKRFATHSEVCKKLFVMKHLQRLTITYVGDHVCDVYFTKTQLKEIKDSGLKLYY